MKKVPGDEIHVENVEESDSVAMSGSSMKVMLEKILRDVTKDQDDSEVTSETAEEKVDELRVEVEMDGYSTVSLINLFVCCHVEVIC